MNFLNCLGVGTVTGTKETNTDEVFIYLPSLFPAADGETISDVKQEKQTSLTKRGDENTSNVLTSNVVTAKWLTENSNRITSPDVREGTKDAVYRISDQDQLYWTTWGISTETMRLETVIYAFSGNPNLEANTPFNFDDYYVLEISTHTKKVSFRTSMANGEPCRMETTYDTEKGTYSYADSQHNVFAVDAMKHAIFMTNEERSLISLEKKNIVISCEDKLALNATNLMMLNSKELKIQNQKTTIQSQLIDINCPTTNTTGDINSDGNIRSLGDITAGGGRISLLAHIHSGVKNGGDESGPPVG